MASEPRPQFTLRSHVFGHPVHTTTVNNGFAGDWVYDDDGSPVTAATRSDRVCPRCHRPPTPEGHDPCIADLPGVVHACCGHGVEPGYVMFEDRRVIRGVFDEEGLR